MAEYILCKISNPVFIGTPTSGESEPDPKQYEVSFQALVEAAATGKPIVLTPVTLPDDDKSS